MNRFRKTTVAAIIGFLVIAIAVLAIQVQQQVRRLPAFLDRFNDFVVMAMLRLPTRESNGKADLHQGAIGAGLSLATGHTMTAVWHDRIISTHPDTGHAVPRLRVPQWECQNRVILLKNN